MTADRYPAPAKLNLMLRVVGRRHDGYHLLQSVFQFVDLSDYLSFDSAPPRHFSCNGGLPDIPPERELTLRAGRLLAEECGLREGIRIALEKHLPAGGGIGGGSSDAATTLIVLNQLWGCGLTRQELMELGIRLGADVPIFIFGQSAWAEGIGEKLFPVPALPEHSYLLVHPGISVSTAEIFDDPQLTRQHPPITIGAFLDGAQENTLEPLVRSRYRDIDACLSWMVSEKLSGAMLTGSGACCFGRLPEGSDGASLMAHLDPSWKAWTVKGSNRHPLHDLSKE